MPDHDSAATRFRDAVASRDVTAMIETMALNIELHSPTMLRPVIGRDRVRAVFEILVDLFEDFEYVRLFEGELVATDAAIASTHALMFRCRIGDERMEGIDILDVDSSDRIARFTVLIRPLSALHVLADSIAERLRARTQVAH